jgi:uncharacterized protein YebE (UPF0316 family)
LGQGYDDPMEAFLGGLLIFVLRLTDVTLGTLRILMTVRGRKPYAALIGFVEVTIFIVAISQVIRNVDSIWNVLGYSGGFAAGTLVGMTLEERLALGWTVVRIISAGAGARLAEELRAAGFGVTEMSGQGMRGSVDIYEVVVRRGEMPRALEIVERVDPKAFVTVEETRRVYRGWRLAK